MKRLNICIDIDGTITDPYYYLELSNKYFNRNITKEQITEYALDKVFGVTEEQFGEFYRKYKFEMHSNQKIRDDVKAVIDKLKGYHNLYFISARDKSMEEFTRIYLEENQIHFNELYLLGSHYKIEKARELNCHIFIEDNYDNAEGLAASGFKVLLIDTYYNRGPLNRNIIRVKDWKEIGNKIDEMLLPEEAV